LLWPGDFALEACSRATFEDLPIHESGRGPGAQRSSGQAGDRQVG